MQIVVVVCLLAASSTCLEYQMTKLDVSHSHYLEILISEEFSFIFNGVKLSTEGDRKQLVDNRTRKVETI